LQTKIDQPFVKVSVMGNNNENHIYLIGLCEFVEVL
jgi:hypothetical protein